MNLLKDNVKKVFLKYLGAAFGSALISSIYSIVDMAMVGQYHGPDGSAAMSVVTPIYNIIYSLGLLSGIGGAVLFSEALGKKSGKQNEFFSISFWCTTVFAVLSWILVWVLEEQLLYLFGADEVLLPLAKRYLLPIKITIPIYIFNQMFSAFLRNDSAPFLATIGVVSGGLFNVVGDYVCVFTFDMGIFGAGLATAIGSGITLIILLSHFLSKKNTLKIVRISLWKIKLKDLLVTGFPTFFIDLAMGILTMLFNRQIMKYLGRSALSVYSVIMMISQLAQCCAYSVGQAAQPILSTNYGAGEKSRIKETLKYSLIVVAILGVVWTVLVMAMPNVFIRIFMTPTEEVLSIAPNIMRVYGISFLLLPYNIFSTYYFQSIMRAKSAIIVSVLRGLVLSGILIYTLPLITASTIWSAMPITELLISAMVSLLIIKYTKGLKTYKAIDSATIKEGEKIEQNS